MYIHIYIYVYIYIYIGFGKVLPKMAAACEPKLEAEELEMKMLPVVQSGGIYDLKWTAQVTRLNL